MIFYLQGLVGAGKDGTPCFIHSPFLQIQSSSPAKRRIIKIANKRNKKNTKKDLIDFLFLFTRFEFIILVEQKGSLGILPLLF